MACIKGATWSKTTVDMSKFYRLKGGIEAGHITVREASILLGISVYKVKRLIEAEESLKK